MKYLLLFIFSISFLLASAQDSTSIAPIDTVAFETEVFEKPQPIRPYLLLDYGKAIMTLAQNGIRYEGTAGVLLFDFINISGSYGYGDIEPTTRAIANGSYSAKGNYWRTGLGILSQFKPEAKIGLGLHYGQSSFDHQGTYASVTSITEEAFEDSFETSNLMANWYEIVLTSESWLRLNKNRPESQLNRLFALGFDMRWRRLVSYDKDEPIDVQAIPGYGNTLNKNSLALNLFLKIYPF